MIANKTITPREDGLFRLPSETDFETITIRDNIIECVGIDRPLMRNSASYGATIENNTLVNVSDVDSFANPSTGAPRGPLAPLRFRCGAEERYLVDQWTITENGAPAGPQTTIAIHAAGRTNTETMELRIDGVLAERWTNVAGDSRNREFATYSYTAPGKVTASQVQVAFTNDDNANRDLLIDRVELDRVAYQSEAPSTYSTGTWAAGSGCAPGYKGSEWLHCNGYLAFDMPATEKSITSPVADQSIREDNAEPLRAYPNPATDWLTVEGTEDYRVTVYDVSGRMVLEREYLRGRTQLSIAALQPGVYLVTLRNHRQGGQTVQQRLMVE